MKIGQIPLSSTIYPRGMESGLVAAGRESVVVCSLNGHAGDSYAIKSVLV